MLTVTAYINTDELTFILFYLLGASISTIPYHVHHLVIQCRVTVAMTRHLKFSFLEESPLSAAVSQSELKLIWCIFT